jgi:NADH-quinone oxidoreductase subunit J
VAALFGYPAVAVFTALMIWVVTGPSVAAKGARLGEFLGSTEAVARLLFREFLLPFEVTSVLILIAIMGAVVLARKEG